MTPAPYNDATEAAVIGACIVFADRVLEDVIATGLHREDFYVPIYAEAWSVLTQLRHDGEPIDAHTVAGRLADPRAVADAIAEAGQSMPGHAPAWARVIISHARCRRMLPTLYAAVRAAEAGQFHDTLALCHAALQGEEVPHALAV